MRFHRANAKSSSFSNKKGSRAHISPTVPPLLIPSFIEHMCVTLETPTWKMKRGISVRHRLTLCPTSSCAKGMSLELGRGEAENSTSPNVF